MRRSHLRSSLRLNKTVHSTLRAVAGLSLLLLAKLTQLSSRLTLFRSSLPWKPKPDSCVNSMNLKRCLNGFVFPD